MAAPRNPPPRRVRAAERGSVTVWMLCWLTGFLVLAGAAVDTANAWRMRAILQSTADAAANAAAVAMAEPGRVPEALGRALARPGSGRPLVDLDPDDPVAVALAVAEVNMPPAANGIVLTREDVVLGTWDAEARRFVPGGEDPDAVRVVTRRSGTNGNPLATFLVRLVGLDAWDVTASAVARVFADPQGPCPDPVLSLGTRVDVQSGDVYVGICLHARADLRADTTGDWVSPEIAALVDRIVMGTADGPPGGGPGLAKVGGLLPGLPTGGGPGLDRAGLRTVADLVLTREEVLRTDLHAGTTYYVECGAGEALVLPETLPLDGVTLLSECPVRMTGDAALDATIIVANLAALGDVRPKADPGPLLPPTPVLGAGGPCAPGDGVRVLVFVDIAASARFALFDSELFPLGGLAAEAGRGTGGIDADALAELGLGIAADVLTGLGLDHLAGVCLDLEFLFEVETVALSQ